MFISIEGTIKNQLHLVQDSTGDASVLTQIFLKKSLTKTDRCVVALSWRRNQMLVLHFLWCVLLNTTLRLRRMSMYISLFTVAIPVNFTSKFREMFEATTYYIYIYIYMYVCQYTKICCWQKLVLSQEEWNCIIVMDVYKSELIEPVTKHVGFEHTWKPDSYKGNLNI